MSVPDETLIDEVDDLQDLLDLTPGEPVDLNMVSRAFVGAYILENAFTGQEVHETMLSATPCEDAAYGDIYRTLAEDHPYGEGWRIKSIVVHPHVIGLYEQAL